MRATPTLYCYRWAGPAAALQTPERWHHHLTNGALVSLIPMGFERTTRHHTADTAEWLREQLLPTGLATDAEVTEMILGLGEQRDIEWAVIVGDLAYIHRVVHRWHYGTPPP